MSKKETKSRVNKSEWAKVRGKKYRMLGPFLLVKEDDVPTKSKGGIIYAPGYQHRVEGWRRGTVLAVGPGTISPKTGNLISVDLNVGDRVFFAKQMGSRIEKLKGVDRWVRIMDPSQIEGTLEEE